MVDKLLNNCFFLGAFSGLIAVLVLYLHNKNTNNIEKDDKIYIKMFILVAVLSCLAVFASQYNLTSSKIIMETYLISIEYDIILVFA